MKHRWFCFAQNDRKKCSPFNRTNKQTQTNKYKQTNNQTQTKLHAALHSNRYSGIPTTIVRLWLNTITIAQKKKKKKKRTSKKKIKKKKNSGLKFKKKKKKSSLFQKDYNVMGLVTLAFLLLVAAANAVNHCTTVRLFFFFFSFFVFVLVSVWLFVCDCSRRAHVLSVGREEFL